MIGNIVNLFLVTRMISGPRQFKSGAMSEGHLGDGVILPKVPSNGFLCQNT